MLSAVCKTIGFIYTVASESLPGTAKPLTATQEVTNPGRFPRHQRSALCQSGLPAGYYTLDNNKLVEQTGSITATALQRCMVYAAVNVSHRLAAQSGGFHRVSRAGFAPRRRASSVESSPRRAIHSNTKYACSWMAKHISGCDACSISLLRREWHVSGMQGKVGLRWNILQLSGSGWNPAT